MAQKEIKLGDKVKDNITGFTGIVIARTMWLMGCDRVGLQAQELKDGKPMGHEWFDVSQVELVEEAPEQMPKETGGPRPDPSR